MSILIDKAELMRHIENEMREWGEDYDALQILGDIEDFPTVDPVRHGNWVGIRRGNDFMRLKLECDVCGAVFYTNSPIELAKFLYCPQCGTRMDEIQITWID